MQPDSQAASQETDLFVVWRISFSVVFPLPRFRPGPHAFHRHRHRHLHLINPPSLTPPGWMDGWMEAPLPSPPFFPSFLPSFPNPPGHGKLQPTLHKNSLQPPGDETMHLLRHHGRHQTWKYRLTLPIILHHTIILSVCPAL